MNPECTMFYVDEENIRLQNVSHIQRTKSDAVTNVIGKLILKSDYLQFLPDCGSHDLSIFINFCEIHRCVLSQKNNDFSVSDSNFKIEINHSDNLYFKIFLKTFQIIEFLIQDTFLDKQTKKFALKFFKDALKKIFGKSDNSNSKFIYKFPTKDLIHKRKIYTQNFFNKWIKNPFASGGTLCDINHNYNEPFHAFPAFFLVPQGWYGADVKNFSQIVNLYRGPVFCFSYPPTKKMLLRSASFIKLSDISVHVEKLTECIKKLTMDSHVKLWDLDNLLPGLLEVKESFETLHKICLPETQSSFNEIDSRWLIKLEQSRWLEILHSVLETVKTIASKIESNSGGFSVVIMERYGRDWTCLISSLVQILFFPEFRTLKGFQELIEKEWILMGHDFIERNGLNNEKSRQIHLFTLFLDCIWQLTNQFPLEFEFSETYLFNLSDASYCPKFIEFGCAADIERCSFIFTKQSVWNWLLSQKSEKEYINPYFIFGKQHLKYKPKTEPLPISTTIWHLKFWKSYYFRGNNFLDTDTSKDVEHVLGNEEFYDEIDYATIKSASSTFYVPS